MKRNGRHPTGRRCRFWSTATAVALVFASTATEAAGAAPANDETLARGQGQETEREQVASKRMTLNFQDIEVRRALQLIADVAGVNLVATDTVAGNVTLRLADVPWDEALQLVLVSNGLDKRRTGDVLLVAPAEEITAREKLALENRRALAELAPLQTKFYEVRYADAASLAELLAGDGTQLALSERGRVLVDERTNSLILTDTPANLTALITTIAQLDTPVRQVQIEARIVSANSDFSEQLGIRWGVALRKDGVAVVPRPAPPAADTEAAPEDIATATFVADGGILARADLAGPGFWLDMQLSASEAAGQAEIIARPKVVTTNKRAATIESGVEIPYQQATKSGATSIAFKDAVLQLQVTPRITPNSRIVMDLEVKQDTVGRIYHGVPSINTTRIATQVLVDDSATVVLGGIFQTDRLRSVVRTPLLGNVPLLGRAFRRTTERDNQQELFIFITPSIVVDDRGAQTDVAEEQA